MWCRTDLPRSCPQVLSRYPHLGTLRMRYAARACPGCGLKVRHRKQQDGRARALPGLRLAALLLLWLPCSACAPSFALLDALVGTLDALVADGGAARAREQHLDLLLAPAAKRAAVLRGRVIPCPTMSYHTVVVCRLANRRARHGSRELISNGTTPPRICEWLGTLQRDATAGVRWEEHGKGEPP